MYKKISKTIILVVFLTFFGIMKVNADDKYLCTYELFEHGKNCSGKICGDDDTSRTQIVTIMTNGKAAFETNGDMTGHSVIGNNYKTSGIQNWDSSYAGFKGYDYYEKNGEKCPPYFIVNWECVGDSKVYFSDDASFNKIKNKTFSCSISPVCDDCEKNEYNGFKLVHQTKVQQERPSKSNKSISCKPKSKSNKDYLDPNVVPTEPLKNDFTTYSCGQGFMTGIPVNIPKFTKFIYNFFQFLVPLTLIILGSIDLIKSITGGKEDEIKKGQQIFIKRLIAGALVFFSLAIVKLLVSVVFPDSSKITNCMNCFITGGSECTKEKELPSYSYTNITSQEMECEEV